MKEQYQKTLESVGVPETLARLGAEILEKETNDPTYQRTEEEQHIIHSGHAWWVAKGKKTIGNETEKTNGYSEAKD